MKDIFDKDHEAFGPNNSGLLDLRFGNADFLANYWLRYDPKSPRFLYGDTNLGYAHAFPNADLKQVILALHDRIKNAVTKDRHVVVGVGASQVLQAALYAAKRRGTRHVIARAPYFPRFRHFSEIVGLQFNADTALLRDLEIVSIPNNPDNSFVKPQIKNYIADCCYNWPQYKDVELRDDDVMVFSLSKATGHASTRIGWALVKDAAFAEDMMKYIEVQSCGVSVEALGVTKQILTNQSQIDNSFTIFKNGSDKLKNRWEKIRLAFSGLAGVQLLNDDGMFLWGKTDGDSTDYFKNLGILSVNGDYFGMNDRNHFRLNIGTDVDSFLKLIEIINAKKRATTKS
jgi:aspartate/methionine/tyrosine aminotransferase